MRFAIAEDSPLLNTVVALNYAQTAPETMFTDLRPRRRVPSQHCHQLKIHREDMEGQTVLQQRA